MRERCPDILSVGPMPPPVQGAAVIHAAVTAALSARATVGSIDIGPGNEPGSHHLRRIRNTGTALRALRAAARSGTRQLYLTVDDGYGVVYALAVVALARRMGLRIAIHHHSFRYLDAPFWAMRALVKLAGPDALHVVLCPLMGRSLVTRYGPRVSTFVLDNARMLPAGSPVVQPTNRAGRLRIGLLSNLTRAKGLDDFLKLLDLAHERGLPLEGHLAGPAVDPAAQESIRSALARLGDRLHWHGPLYGAAKEPFWQQLDVFVFPTLYRSEAQPVVLLEAMLRGLPVIARGRGCIGHDVDAGGLVLPVDGDFVEPALGALTTWLKEPAELRRVGEAALRQAHLRYERSTGAWEALCDRLLASDSGRD